MLLFAVGFTVFFAAYEKLVSKQLRTVDCKVTNGHTLKFGPNKRTKEGNLVKKNCILYMYINNVSQNSRLYFQSVKCCNPLKEAAYFSNSYFLIQTEKINYIVSVYNKRLQLFSKISCLCNCTKLS